MTFGEKIQKLRKQQGLSQEALAEKVTVTRQTISKWELDQSTPDLEFIAQLSSIFGVSADYLIGLSDIQDSAEKLVGDEDFVSLQRAKSRMSPQDKERMMGMLRLGFHEAFKDEEQ